MTIKEFTGKKVSYDKLGQIIFGRDGSQMILDVRGWGFIQNQFKTEEAAGKFQDNFGQFVVDAINEKLHRQHKD